MKATTNYRQIMLLRITKGFKHQSINIDNMDVKFWLQWKSFLYRNTIHSPTPCPTKLQNMSRILYTNNLCPKTKVRPCSCTQLSFRLTHSLSLSPLSHTYLLRVTCLPTQSATNTLDRTFIGGLSTKKQTKHLQII